jgi:bacterioferritin-associated ferredoxin
MYVCLCQAITESQIKACVRAGAADLQEVSAALGVATGCGCCREHAESIIAVSRAPVFADNFATRSATLRP